MTWRADGGPAALEAPVPRPAWLRLVAGNLLVGLGYYGLAKLGSVVQLTGAVQVAWLPVGYAVHRKRSRRWATRSSSSLPRS